MNDYFIERNNNLLVMHLLNTIVFIEDGNPNVTICSMNDTRLNVTFMEKDILEISRIKNEKYPCCNEIIIGNTTIDLGTDWLLFRNNNSFICMCSETFEIVVEYIKINNRKGEK